MEIRETSRTLSPFELNAGRIGSRLSWLISASGRAYLAFCPQDERRRIIRQLRERGGPQDWLAFDQGRLGAVLAQTAARGYAVRASSPYGGFDERPFLDYLDGIATPVTQGHRVESCINLIWVKGAARAQEMAERHLNDLKAAATEIAAAAT